MRLDLEPPGVYLVLDQEFGSGIDSLIDLGTIYLVDSETNRLAIKRYKELHPDRDRPLGIITISLPYTWGFPSALPMILLFVGNDMRELCEVTVISPWDFEKSMQTIKIAGYSNYREGLYNGSRTIVVMVSPEKRRHRLTLINGGKSS